MNRPKSFLIAGDVCLDLVGVPQPPQGDVECPREENWRLTGEVRTHVLPGGAMLLAEMVRHALAADQPADQPPAEVRGPMPVIPERLRLADTDAKATETEKFLRLAERLTPRDVVHSLLAAGPFPTKPGEKREKVLRIVKCHGYSGPGKEDTLLPIGIPAGGSATIVVLDDTGNQFRREESATTWPAEITEGPAGQGPLVVHKLHRPLPKTDCSNALWDLVTARHARNRVVVVAVEDLRKAGAPISLGLSWERTALDVVWHLLNFPAFALLRDCPHLVVRLGLEGALVWHRPQPEKGKPDEPPTTENAGTPPSEAPPEWNYKAWLVYDPKGIEGSVAAATPGSMVACGSVFTAAMVARLAGLTDQAFALLLAGGPAWQEQDDEPGLDFQHAFLDAVEVGLGAARRHLARGFGCPQLGPSYPGPDIFASANDDVNYARHPIPIIPDATTSDRGYWRLLESLFENRTALLHNAVANVAVGKKVEARPLPWKKADLDRLDNITDEGERRKVDAAHASWLLKASPRASFGKLVAYDRREIEQYRSLYSLLRDYLQNPKPERPLSLAVFGPPGAGKSFGVKEVAASLKDQLGCKEVDTLTFNLSLYQSADDLAAAFHLVRDKALEGKVPLVFFDEFDTALDGKALGWLRCFLAPMQDGKFLDRGSEHPIGPAIFVFAGGTCDSFKEFDAHANMAAEKFKCAKGPDFLSRLRATLDIPSLNLLVAAEPESKDPANPQRGLIQPPGTFNPYGPTEDFPSIPSILLRRASILAFNLRKKAPELVRADGSLHVDPSILRALLLLPEFNHGNRSFEAILDMSHLSGADHFTPALLPAPFQLPLHVNACLLRRLVGTAYPYSAEDRDRIALEIHGHYLEQRKLPNGGYDATKPSHQEWANLVIKYRDSNREQADDLPRKLLALGYWLRKTGPALPAGDPTLKNVPRLLITSDEAEMAARQEHDRWVAMERRKGTIWGMKAKPQAPFTHPCILSWSNPGLTADEKAKDREAISHIPRYLAAAGYEVFKP